MKKPFIKYFPMGILPALFGFATDKEAFDNEMKRLGHEGNFFESPACTRTFPARQKNEYFTIIVTLSSTDDDRNYIASIIAHEAYHVVCTIAEEMGESKPGEEVVAYAVQYFTKLMLDELKT